MPYSTQMHIFIYHKSHTPSLTTISILMFYGFTISILSPIFLFISKNEIHNPKSEIHLSFYRHCVEFLVSEIYCFAITAFMCINGKNICLILYLSTYLHMLCGLTNTGKSFSVVKHAILVLVGLIRCIAIQQSLAHFGHIKEKSSHHSNWLYARSFHIDRLIRAVRYALFYLVLLDFGGLFELPYFDGSAISILLYCAAFAADLLISHRIRTRIVIQCFLFFFGSFYSFYVVLRVNDIFYTLNHVFESILALCLELLLFLELRLREQGAWQPEESCTTQKPEPKL